MFLYRSCTIIDSQNEDFFCDICLLLLSGPETAFGGVRQGSWSAREDLLRLARDADIPNMNELIQQLALTTLVDLIDSVNLATTLSENGPFTVFAPSNDAFEAKALLKNPSVLDDILLFHVVPGNFSFSSLQNELLVDTLLAGIQLRINNYTQDGKTTSTASCAPIDLNDVDKPASHGLVHLLSHLMFPPIAKIMESLDQANAFKILIAAVQTAILQETLSGDGPFIIFTPTDQAFKNLPNGVLDNLFQNVTALTNVIKYHLISGTYCSEGLVSGHVPTLAGQDVTTTISSGKIE